MSGIMKLVTSLRDEEVQLLQQLRNAVKKRRERPASSGPTFGARIADAVAAMVGPCRVIRVDRERAKEGIWQRQSGPF